MLEAFSEAFAELERNPDARCGVVFAHGAAFTAGLDLADVAPRLAQGELRLGGDRIDPWGVHGRRVTKPVVGAFHGLCLTLGIELALALDVRVASADVRFAQIEVKRGIFPFGGGTWRLPAAAGWGNAMRWLLTGDEFGADEALRIGLVQEVVPAGRQVDRAIEIAETIAAQAPLGVRATLASARLAEAEGEAAAARALIPTLLDLMKSDDAREGMMSFLERRPGRFTGK
jgi:enoyl-CoA hydratase/carnithine racemase